MARAIIRYRSHHILSLADSRLGVPEERSRRRLAIWPRVWTRSLASRFDNGSSIKKTWGSRTIARPIATRWRWPPDSARGLRRCRENEGRKARRPGWCTTCGPSVGRTVAGADRCRHDRRAALVVGDVLDEEGAAIAESLGDAVQFVHRDVTEREQWEAAVGVALREFGQLNVLVTNAGIINGSPLQDFDLANWRKIIDVNLTGTFLGMRIAVKPMIAGGGGSIINISSIEGLRGAPRAHGYVASKWAVRGLAKAAALELAPHNIRVNSIHPGLIRTPMTANIPDDMVNIPLGRAADPIEMSTFVLFLASDESSYASGSEFVMDGGLVTAVPHKAP